MTIQNIFHSSLQMTSLEIADLVGSRHDSVKRCVERLAKQSVIQLPPLVKVEDKQSLSPNSKTSVYIFEGEKGKRDSIVVVAQLSPEFTARLVDRWQELEAKIAKPSLQPANIDFDLLIDKERTALELLKNRLNAATLFNVPEHIAQQEATKLILTETGVDYTPLMLAAPAQDDIATQDEMLEPTDLAKRLGIRNAIKMNLILEHLGLQTKVRDTWLPTLEGEDLCIKHAWSKGTKSGYNLKWRVTAINAMLDRQFKLGTLNARDINE
jgi:phage regulator Rha-like protein